jgi:ADP-ribose pyrophosphatase YjhB (NUDIX family)
VASRRSKRRHIPRWQGSARPALQAATQRHLEPARGHIEPGEKAIEAAHRELNEETGITADLKGLADVANVILRRDDGALRAHYVISVFYGIWMHGEAKTESDCQAVEWVDIAELSERPMTDGTAAIIARAASLLSSQDDSRE